ncbi:MAG: CoA transferase [Rhodobacteraceae bacterium]|nr:CoA transferase [Paracoccaceae bacterium]MBR28267.1 CoA transferase [Paracoccaceae bacterium]
MTDEAPARTGFLSPYRVLDLSDHRGLIAGRMFAQLGADVVQIEPPQGSNGRKVGPFDDRGRSMHWESYAAGKRSLVLDPDAPGDRETLLALVAKADFVFESRGPNEPSRLTPDEIAAANPAIIHMIATPYGMTGPKADYAESDLVLWASGGPLAPTAMMGGTPTRISVPQAWTHASADAVGGGLIAHFARLRSGKGQLVSTSAQRSATQSTLSGSLADVVGQPDFSLRPRYTGSKKPLDLSGSGARTQRSKWPSKDGLLEIHLAIGPATGRFTNNFMKLLIDRGALSPEFHDWDWGTIHHRIMADEIDDDDLERVREEVGRFLLELGHEEAVQLAIERKLLLAPVSTVKDLVESPHEAARDFFDVAKGSDGAPVTLPGPFAMTEAPGFMRGVGAPALGAHSEAVLTEWLGSAARASAAPATATPTMEGAVR